MANGCPGYPPLGGPLGGGAGSAQDTEAADKARTSSPENGRASPSGMVNPFYTGSPRTPVTSGSRNGAIDRQEIIRRIKSRESRPTSPELDRAAAGGFATGRLSPVPAASDDPSEAHSDQHDIARDNQSIGMEIARPRSALHQGDFREKEQYSSAFENFGARASQAEDVLPLATSPVAPWHPAFPSAVFRHVREERRPAVQEISQSIAGTIRPRVVSNASLATTFAYKPPTSPLVQSSRPDTPEPPTHPLSRSPDKFRRYTMSPPSLRNFQSTLEHPVKHPSLRAERTFPYQAHQPRRSLNSASFSHSPQTPIAGPRRPSLSDSPLHHAPMVGSYEESILRGRMSTTPSKPLNFVAQIGVLGKGDCKANLRCPRHVSLPFPAVFYSYASGSTAATGNDRPSPYVGLIDLENDLPRAEVPDRRRQRVKAAITPEGSRASSRVREEGSADESHVHRRKRQKQKRRSGSPKAPPGGSYRIPQQGQLQIVIKNPNKTAVKLFLVPYDLSDMEPGQKTFIRQRSYSAGPIIDMPLSQRKNYGTDRPEAALSASDDPNERPVLRYLIHLNFCCPSKGRLFLYKSVRVVFANRVPDGKESLRNEIQMPEPRYSTYKPGRDSASGLSGTGPLKDVNRRRSALDALDSAMTPLDEQNWPGLPNHLAHSLPPAHYNPRYEMPVQTLPRHFTTLPTLESRPASRQHSEGMDVDSERSQDTQSVRSPLSSPGAKEEETSPLRTVPRLEDPFIFQRDQSQERRTGQQSESLLSRRLMDLAFEPCGDTRADGFGMP